MSQKQIALFENQGLPQGAVAVNRRACFQDVNGNRAVFVDQTAYGGNCGECHGNTGLPGEAERWREEAICW